MGEQSHLEAMREAIKGDLERARSRRPSIFERPAEPIFEIRQAPTPPPSNNLLQGTTGPEPTAEPEPVAEAPATPEPEPVAEAPVAESQPGPEPEVVAEPEPEPKPSLWSRLAFWR
jgi:hypothetical protein